MKSEEIFNENIYKIIISDPVRDGKYKRVEITRTGSEYQAAMYTQKQVFHRNLEANEIEGYVAGLLGSAFKQYNAWDGEYRYSARISKKGKWLTSRTADATPQKEKKTKNHILNEGMDIPALADMKADREKLAQINRFLELISDEVRHLTPDDAMNIIDFGCGKSYLTFLAYHYFTVIRGLRVRMCGLDNDGKLVEQCNAAAQRYGYTGLDFLQGDIGQRDRPPFAEWGHEGTFNMVVCLHACDTATDHALFNAIEWGADLICAVPCCQHELRGQMQAGILPLFSRYGIVQERMASLATDAIRAAMLEWRGYKVQIIELTDRENTAKNLMIRARKKGSPMNEQKKAAYHQVMQMMAAFGFEPAIWRLLHPSPSNK
ncbi:MAG: SAM-dependent methyltransferase [Defluviitaleaceae bacterium]|nr:SAM-dependent methyltransferase [Defluviitaleaceae bacterium]